MSEASTDGLRAAADVKPRPIPEATVARLTTYLQVLGRFPSAAADGGDGTISSDQLAALVGVNSAKLRKDLSYLGSQGTRGVGYDVAGLTATLEGALGTRGVYPVAIVGTGHLGSALAGYPGFAGRGMPIRVLFDSDPAKIGTRIAGIVVSDIADAASVCRAAGVAIAVVTTPESAAQRVVDALVAAGVRSLLNFAPASLSVPADVELRRIDLALELNLLAFHESRRGPGPQHTTAVAE